MIVGIDLGTWNSTVSYLNDSGRPELTIGEFASPFTPSIVSCDRDGKIHVGVEAARGRGIDHGNIERFKRYMGTDQPPWEIGGQEFTPTTASKTVLEKLKMDFEQQHSQIDRAVITVPAKFSDSARHETLKAAKLAGLNVIRLLDEPTAAALYYYHRNSDTDFNGKYCVVDLGGGTLDISILEINRGNITLLGNGGNLHLGGAEFDEQLRQIVTHKFQSESNNDRLDSSIFNSRDAEIAKKFLTKFNEYSQRIQGKNGAVEIRISRDEFVESISEYLQDIERACVMAMEDAKVTPRQLRKIILVGGSTRVPAVVKTIRRVFELDCDPEHSKECDAAIAHGAALYAAYRENRDNPARQFTVHQRQAIKQLNIKEVLHRSYGVISIDGVTDEETISTVISRGTEIPCTKMLDFRAKPRQRRVQWKITESEGDISDPQLAMTLREVHFDVRNVDNSWRKLRAYFSCDSNKILHCKFKDLRYNTETGISVSLEARSTSEHQLLPVKEIQ